MDKEAALHALMLSELPHVGEKGAERILQLNAERQHSLATFFRLPEVVLRDEYKLHPLAVACIVGGREEHEQRCQWMLDRLASVNGHVWIAGDPAYPARLRQRLRPLPPVLSGIGSTEVLRASTLAVLNSRSVSEHGVSATLAIVQAAAADEFTLIGGGMKTGYRIAAVAGRAAAAARVIVLDRGIFASFGARFDRDPFGFGPGRSPLDATRTLVISPFRLLDHASPRSGQRRDEVIAALADVVVAVHARAGGQMERVCLEALDRGQCVLSWYGENAGLIAAGARPITEADLASGLRGFIGRLDP